jgi:hypothetical protein
MGVPGHKPEYKPKAELLRCLQAYKRLLEDGTGNFQIITW